MSSSDHPPSALAHTNFPTEFRLQGIPAAPGIVIGRSGVFRFEPTPSQEQCIICDPLLELERFDIAHTNCCNELQSIFELAQTQSPTAAPIIEAQLLMLQDPSLISDIHTLIQTGVSSEQAVSTVFERTIHVLKSARDTFLRERAIDLEHLKRRVIDYLHQRKYSADIATGRVLIAPALMPSEVILFHEAEMQAFVTEISGIASHAAILARSMNIPAVIGVRDASTMIPHDVPIIIDGYAGRIIVYPRAETLQKYETRKNDLDLKQKRLGKYAQLSAETRDKHPIKLYANLDTPDEIDDAKASGMEGVGLVRTEHLILRLNHIPSEIEQTAWYTALAERAFPLPITLRAFDIGSDKSFESMPTEPNPALGMRGVRYLLTHRPVMEAQFRAVLKASRHRNVRLLLPMISGVKEFSVLLDVLESCKASLRQHHIEFDEHIQVGAMIETPSSALMADELAKRAHFFSIGTNDLTQYVMAADRTNEHVIQYFDPFHPAVLRLIRMVITSAHAQNISVSVCGEFAGHPIATELLIGMGITELSVVPSLLLEVKKRIRKMNFTDAQELSSTVLSMYSGTDVREYLHRVKNA